MSNRVRDAIRRSGKTNAELAVELGVTRQAITEIVKGRTRGAMARYALASALGLTVADLWPAESSTNERAPAA